MFGKCRRAGKRKNKGGSVDDKRGTHDGSFGSNEAMRELMNLPNDRVMPKARSPNEMIPTKEVYLEIDKRAKPPARSSTTVPCCTGRIPVS